MSPDALRRELGGFLRAVREHTAPADVGLAAGPRRRTPGLRREEVATLSGVSLAWYTWLEQGRVAVSRQVLDAVCRVLRMDAGARRHALELAGFHDGSRSGTALPDTVVPGDTAPGDTVPGGGSRDGSAPDGARGDAVPPARSEGDHLRRLIDAWPGTPALILDRRLDISGWNTAYRETVHDLSAVPGERRNLLLLLVGDLTEAVPEWPRLLRALHGWFRSGTDHLPDDPRVAAIRRLLAAERPDLAHWWRCRAVADFASTTLEVRGVPMTLSLLRPDASADAAVLACTPVRASSAPPAAERLRSG